MTDGVPPGSVCPTLVQRCLHFCGAGAFAQCYLNKPRVVRRKKCACARRVERPLRLPRRRPCRRYSGNADRNTGMAGETPAPQCRNCNAAEFVGRTRASPEEADVGVGLRSRGTGPRFNLDTAAAYLSGIGRCRLPTAFLTASRGAVGTFHGQNFRYGLFSINRNRYSPTSRA